MKPFSLLLLGILGLGISSQPFSCFPRMHDQPSVKPFERTMPEAPPNQVPYAGPESVSLTKQQAAAMSNPVKPTSQAIALGRIYYGYYCLMCHGETGKGDGPVGQSYVPPPADLTSPKVLAQSDGALAYAMVSGTGHDPVLASTVPLSRRWPIIHYLRTLGPPPWLDVSPP